MAGEEVQVEVSVTAVKEQQLPDLDDDFAQMASEFDTLEELREDIRTRLGNQRRLEQMDRKHRRKRGEKTEQDHHGEWLPRDGACRTGTNYPLDPSARM